MKKNKTIQLIKDQAKYYNYQLWKHVDQTKLGHILNQIDYQLAKNTYRLTFHLKNSQKYSRQNSYFKAFTQGALFITIFLSFQSFTTYKLPFYIPFYDAVGEQLIFSNNLQERAASAMDSIVVQGIKNGSLDANTYIAIGKIYAQANLPDIAQSAFYMAHLKENSKFPANSDLKLETTSKTTNEGILLD